MTDALRQGVGLHFPTQEAGMLASQIVEYGLGPRDPGKQTSAMIHLLNVCNFSHIL